MQKPNIILILADDMGYGDLGIFSDGSAKTPALDDLVSNGVTLSQHYAGSPVCAPSRAALLTGRYPHRTGVIDTFEVKGYDRLALNEITVGDLLKSTGYATGLIGKWHLGALDKRYHPNKRGFDEFVGFCGGWNDYYNYRLDYNGTCKKSDGTYITDVFTRQAVDFIKRHSKEPFFLHVAYNAPHFPYQAPEDEIEYFRGKNQFNEKLCTLYAMIRRMDKGVERIIEELKRQGIEDNTVVIFTSDNGPQLKGDLKRYNGNFRGQKTTVYEGGIRVPAVIKWPAELDKGLITDSPVHFADWLPTMLKIAGEEVAKSLELDGHNVLDVLKGKKDNYNICRFWQWNRSTPVMACNGAIRKGDWKLVRPIIKKAMEFPKKYSEMTHQAVYRPDIVCDIIREPEPDRGILNSLPPLLFNITKDPSEKNNLAGDNPKRVESMLKDYEAWFNKMEAERRMIE